MSTSGSMRRPVRRFFWASTRKSHGAASGLFFTKARRFGSRRCARSTASTSARRSGLGLQFHGGAGAAMTPVVPLKAHDAAAGAQVCRLLAAPRLAEAGQQKRVRAEPVDGGAVYFCFIIQNLGRMFHTPSRNPPTKYCVPKDEKIMQERKAADPPGRSAAFDALFARYLLKIIQR